MTIVIESSIDTCPYLDIEAGEVFCRASNWGSKYDPKTGQIKQRYGLVDRALILDCNSARHVTCSMYQKERHMMRSDQ